MYQSRLTQEQRAAVVKELFEVAATDHCGRPLKYPLSGGICIHLSQLSLRTEAADLSMAVRSVMSCSIYSYLPSALGLIFVDWEEEQKAREIWLEHWVQTGMALTRSDFPLEKVLKARMGESNE